MNAYTYTHPTTQARIIAAMRETARHSWRRNFETKTEKAERRGGCAMRVLQNRRGEGFLTIAHYSGYTAKKNLDKTSAFIIWDKNGREVTETIMKSLKLAR